MMSKAYEHAMQKSAASSKSESKALSEAELNSKMLEYISSSTFDSMMELNNEEVKEQAAQKNGKALKDSKEQTLVQTQSEL